MSDSSSYKKISFHQTNHLHLFAEFLSFDKKPQREEAYSKEISKDGYIRKPGILKRKMVMADDFDETPECFKEYM